MTLYWIDAWYLKNIPTGLDTRKHFSGWPATQEADQQGGEVHLRPLPRHRTLPGAVHCISPESTVTAFQIRRSFISGSSLPNLQSIALVNPMCQSLAECR